MRGVVSVNDADAYMACGVQGFGLIQPPRYMAPAVSADRRAEGGNPARMEAQAHADLRRLSAQPPPVAQGARLHGAGPLKSSAAARCSAAGATRWIANAPGRDRSASKAEAVADQAGTAPQGPPPHAGLAGEDILGQEHGGHAVISRRARVGRPARLHPWARAGARSRRWRPERAGRAGERFSSVPGILRIFLAAARYLNFSRAAEQLHLTRRAVSKHISRARRFGNRASAPACSGAPPPACA